MGKTVPWKKNNPFIYQGEKFNEKGMAALLRDRARKNEHAAREDISFRQRRQRKSTNTYS